MRGELLVGEERVGVGRGGGVLWLEREELAWGEEGGGYL